MWPGKMDKGECFGSEREDAAMLEVLLDIIPFLGPYLGTGLSYLIYFFTFLLTLAIASLVTSVAYLIYRPLIGLLYLGLSLGVFFLIQFFSQDVGPAPTPVQAM